MKLIKYLIVIIFLITAGFVFYFSYSKINQLIGRQKIVETANAAATINASSCSYTDVSFAIASASAGDTVNVPAGDCIWSYGQSVIISKELILQGAGIGQTIIRRPSPAQADTIFLVDAASDVPVRITGFDFRLPHARTTYNQAIKLVGPFTQIRIDNNKFEGGSNAIYPTWGIYGVIDHNQFLNCDICIRASGTETSSWALPILAGTSNSLFIEDNTFTKDNNIGFSGPNQDIYHQNGARTTIRYNIFDASAMTTQAYAWIDSHGNYDGPLSDTIGPTLTLRGQPLIELYNNTVNTASNIGGVFDIRGGSVIAYDNSITTTSSQVSWIKLWEEETWASCNFCGVWRCTTWPCYDQINNSFFWNNTRNGVAFNPYKHSNNQNNVIQLDRDYFNTAPQSSGGSESYPGVGGDNDMTYSSSGANAYYPYTPYTYPHPLTLDSTPPPVSNFSPNQIIEAESGQISAPMQTGVSGLDTYVYTPSIDNTGSVKFNFDIPTTGLYKMEAKVNSNNNGGQNSFYVGLDNESAQNNILYSYNIFPLAAGFVWDEVSKWGNGTTLPQFDPITWNLTQGIHYFTFYGREFNTWLDQIRLVSTITDITPPSAPSGVVVQ